MTHLRAVDRSWPAEELEVLYALQESLEERGAAGDPHARLTLQVVVAFIAELEGPPAAAFDV